MRLNYAPIASEAKRRDDFPKRSIHGSTETSFGDWLSLYLV